MTRRLSNISAQVEYHAENSQRVSQLTANVEYTIPANYIRMTKLFIVVEYTEGTGPVVDWGTRWQMMG